VRRRELPRDVHRPREDHLRHAAVSSASCPASSPGIGSTTCQQYASFPPRPLHEPADPPFGREHVHREPLRVRHRPDQRDEYLALVHVTEVAPVRVLGRHPALGVGRPRPLKVHDLGVEPHEPLRRERKHLAERDSRAERFAISSMR
jgi:hypothetical protein